MYDIQKCLPTHHPLGRRVHARSRWHQKSWWVGSTPNTTRRCRVYAGIFEQMPGYQNLMTEVQLLSEVVNSWRLVLCAVTGIDGWLQLWGSQLSVFMFSCLLNAQAALFDDWYAYQQTYVACRHIHRNPHIHRSTDSTFSLKVLVYWQTRLLEKNQLH